MYQILQEDSIRLSVSTSFLEVKSRANYFDELVKVKLVFLIDSINVLGR